MANDPCQVPGSSNLRKRKQPDEDEHLAELPIENEYENLDDDDDDDDDEAGNDVKIDQNDLQEILEAQNPATINQYDGIKITPFNLEEECEEGEFDNAGNFTYKKDDKQNEEYDTWAESVNWKEVDEREKLAQANPRPRDQSTSKKDTEVSKRDKFDCYRQMLRIMKSDETVQKTIRRLGNSVPKRRNNCKNKGDTPKIDASEVAETKARLDLIIEMAHHLLEEGDVDIYQKSYEQLEEALDAKFNT